MTPAGGYCQEEEQQEADDGGDAGIDEYGGQILDSEVMGACLEGDCAESDVGWKHVIFFLYGAFEKGETHTVSLDEVLVGIAHERELVVAEVYAD